MNWYCLWKQRLCVYAQKNIKHNNRQIKHFHYFTNSFIQIRLFIFQHKSAYKTVGSITLKKQTKLGRPCDSDKSLK